MRKDKTHRHRGKTRTLKSVVPATWNHLGALRRLRSTFIQLSVHSGPTHSEYLADLGDGHVLLLVQPPRGSDLVFSE
jgi:hypothetical protein